jgi:hypothetical protein
VNCYCLQEIKITVKADLKMKYGDDIDLCTEFPDSDYEFYGDGIKEVIRIRVKTTFYKDDKKKTEKWTFYPKYCPFCGKSLLE